jgi:hypothetical protein
MPKKKRYKIKRFVALRWDMLNHKSYIDLPPNAKGMLPYFLGKVKIPFTDPTYYHAEFSLTYSEAEKYGCSRRTFYRVIECLISHGLIDPIRKGGRNGGRDLQSIFRISTRWQSYGTAVYRKITWAEFGKEQLISQVEKWHSPVADNTLGEKGVRELACQK